MKCLKVLKRHLINHLEIYTQTYQLPVSSCSFLGFFLIGKRQHQKFNKSCSRTLNTADTPLKISTEHINEGWGSMIFLCTWVSLRSQPIIFQRVPLISSSAEVSTVTMWTGNLNLNLLWRPHRLNHLDFFGAILNPKKSQSKDIQNLSKLQYWKNRICWRWFKVQSVVCSHYRPLFLHSFIEVKSESIIGLHSGRCYGKDGCLSWFLFSNFKLRYTVSTCDNSDVVQLEVFSFYEYSI